MSTSTTDPAAWTRLRERLIATGAMTPDGTTRKAQPRRCRTCNAHIITGLDDFTAALAITADPTPLDQTGELTATLTGRPTYTLEHDGTRLVLNYRDAGRIRHRPPGGNRYDVLPAHQCWQPMAGTSSVTRAISEPTPTKENAPCPF